MSLPGGGDAQDARVRCCVGARDLYLPDGGLPGGGTCAGRAAGDWLFPCSPMYGIKSMGAGVFSAFYGAAEYAGCRSRGAFDCAADEVCEVPPGAAGSECWWAFPVAPTGNAIECSRSPVLLP